jgi:hypothetical protein
MEDSQYDASFSVAPDSPEGSLRKSSMKYKEIAYFHYLLVTLLIYFLQITGSILIDDIGVVFEWLAAFGISSLTFIFPGAFFLRAERRFASTF